MPTVVREYDAKLDSRDRLVLRDSSFDHYHVIEYEDGSYLLEPRVLAHPSGASENTLRMMDRSIESLDAGAAGRPLDLGSYAELVGEDEGEVHHPPGDSRGPGALG